MKKPDTVRTSFGKVIKKRLVDKDMTQSELADAIGTSKAQITRIIYGYRSATNWVDAICQVLDIKDPERFKEVT